MIIISSGLLSLQVPGVVQDVSVPQFENVDIEGDKSKRVPQHCQGVTFPGLIHFGLFVKNERIHIGIIYGKT